VTKFVLKDGVCDKVVCEQVVRERDCVTKL
jgi:hypothetical protein